MTNLTLVCCYVLCFGAAALLTLSIDLPAIPSTVHTTSPLGWTPFATCLTFDAEHSIGRVLKPIESPSVVSSSTPPPTPRIKCVTKDPRVLDVRHHWWIAGEGDERFGKAVRENEGDRQVELWSQRRSTCKPLLKSSGQKVGRFFPSIIACAVTYTTAITLIFNNLLINCRPLLTSNVLHKYDSF
jgi:hypothetical protein